MSDAAALKQAVLDAHDPFAEYRKFSDRLATKISAWAGLPTPIEGVPMIIHPKFPGASIFNDIEDKRAGVAGSEGDIDLSEVKVRNQFWSTKHKTDVVVFDKEDGKVDAGFTTQPNMLFMILETMASSVAWGVEQEANAQKLLGELLSHNAFKKYLMAGVFMERSPRSGLMYVFRKLRPTLVLSDKFKDNVRVIAALCLHPIGYYKTSWAGVMVPTDDIVAHLMLMRGDEHLFWKRANQIPPGHPLSGIGV